jgi:RNA polymerase sigma-70 factor, ECF subfamily
MISPDAINPMKPVYFSQVRAVLITTDFNFFWLRKFQLREPGDRKMVAARLNQIVPVGNLNYPTVSTPSYSKDQAQQQALSAFNELVLENQDAVYRQAYWILGEPEAAEDAAQEAFLRAFRNLSSYNGGPFRPWILKITTNYCLDQLRQRKTHPNIPIDLYDEYEDEVETPPWIKDPGTSVEESLVRAEERARIMNCIRKLPADYRTAITLVDLQELDYSEAAAVMGVPLGTFKSRLFRARMLLQKSLSHKTLL